MDRPSDRSAPSPWSRVLRALRDRLVADRGIRSADVAALLECTPQLLSSWCSSGVHGREPPLWAIRRLQKELDLAVILLPDEVQIVPIDTLDLED